MQTNSLLQIHAKSLKIYVLYIYIYTATSILLSIFRIPDTMWFRFSVIFVIQSLAKSTLTAIKFDQDRERNLLVVTDNTVEKNFAAPREGRHWRRKITANVGFQNYLNTWPNKKKTRSHQGRCYGMITYHPRHKRNYMPININNCPTRCNTKQSIYYSAGSLYMFRELTTPIIRNTQNYNYSLRYCAATSLQRGQASLGWPRWREVAAHKIYEQYRRL